MINTQADIVGGNMARRKSNFGGKKAAPFKKGGGRSTKHPHTAKGLPRKRGKK
jgi:hypothetical protein